MMNKRAANRSRNYAEFPRCSNANTGPTVPSPNFDEGKDIGGPEVKRGEHWNIDSDGCGFLTKERRALRVRNCLVAAIAACKE